MRTQRTAGFAARTTAAFLAIIATLALLAPAAFAQNEYLVGRKVMTIKWAAEFRLGKRVVSNEELGEVFTVDKVNGARGCTSLVEEAGYRTRTSFVSIKPSTTSTYSCTGIQPVATTLIVRWHGWP